MEGRGSRIEGRGDRGGFRDIHLHYLWIETIIKICIVKKRGLKKKQFIC